MLAATTRPIRNSSSSFLAEATTAVAATANSAFFGNFKRGHKIVIRKGLVVKTSDHYLFGNGMIAVAGDARWGATVKYKNYIARLNHPAS